MPLSRRVWPLIVALGVCGMAPLPRASASAARVVVVDYDWVDGLERRIQKLLPNLLGSLAAVRRERDPQLVRCFDRAIAELHSVSRQVEYHADRLEDERPAERTRHQKALLLLGERVEKIAQSRIGCFTEGAVVKSGETRVEVVYVRR